MIPAIFYNHPGLQIVVLIKTSLIYIIILTGLKIYENQTEYKIDIFSELMLLVMQIHMLVFIDGGLINGTPNNVCLENQIWFMT